MKNLLKNITAEQFNASFSIGAEFRFYPRHDPNSDSYITYIRQPAVDTDYGETTVITTMSAMPVLITHLEPIMNVKQIATIKEVKNGADIYCYELACQLRHIERYWPHYIDICAPQAYSGDGSDQVPYFGAITTAAGNQFLASLEAKNDE